MNRKPMMMLGLMVMIGITVGAMIVVMVVFAMVGDMGQLMFGSGARAMVIIPMAALIVMVLVMLVFFRKIFSRGGPMAMMRGQTLEIPPGSREANLTVLNYDIPGVSCAHCKATIEQAVGQLPGVAAVEVDVDTRRATIKLITTPTATEIEALLSKIGYAPSLPKGQSA